MQRETWLKTDLKKLPEVKKQMLTFTEDSLANKIGVILTNANNAVNIAGTVSGKIIRADGETITVSGSKSGNTGWIILPEEAYAVPGELTISICESIGDKKTTLAVCVGHVLQAATELTGGE